LDFFRFSVLNNIKFSQECCTFQSERAHIFTKRINLYWKQQSCIRHLQLHHNLDSVKQEGQPQYLPLLRSQDSILQVCCQSQNRCLLITTGPRANRTCHSPRMQQDFSWYVQWLFPWRVKVSTGQTSGRTQPSQTGGNYWKNGEFFSKSAETGMSPRILPLAYPSEMRETYMETSADCWLLTADWCLQTSLTWRWYPCAGLLQLIFLAVLRWISLLELSQPAETISGVVQDRFKSQIPASCAQSSELQIHSLWP